MKQLLMMTLLFALSSGVKAQQIHNNAACDISVSPLCYDPNGHNGTPPDCTFMPPGPSTPVSAFSSAPLPTCNPPGVPIAYKVCWNNGFCNENDPSNCVVLDAASHLYPNCALPTPVPVIGGGWPFTHCYTFALPNCIDCAGGSSTVNVSIDINTGDITFN